MDEINIIARARRIVAAVAKSSFGHDDHDVEAILHGSIDHTLAIKAVVLALRPKSVTTVLCDQILPALSPATSKE